MKISPETIAVLKNFAQINTNILVRPGSELATITAHKDIYAKATVKEEFPIEFAIYDLTNLLPLLTLTDNHDIEFGEKSMKIILENGEFEYFYADPSIIVAPPQKKISVDEYFTFKLTKEDLSVILKSAAIVSAPTLSVVSKDGKVMLSVGDPKTPASNSFKKVIGEFDADFNISIPVSQLKVITESYEVILSKRKFIHLRNEDRELYYWFAAEPSSVI